MRSLLIFILFFFTLSLYGQKTQKELKIDSLFSLTKNAPHDTTVVQAFIKLEGLIFRGNIDTIEYFYNQIKSIAEKNLKNENLSEREKYIFKSKLAEVTSDMGYLRTNRGNLVEGMKFYLKGMRMRERIQDLEGLGNSYNNLSTAYNKLEEYDKSLMYCKKSLKIRKKLNDMRSLALVYNNMGYVYNQLDLADSALHCYRKSYHIYDSLDNAFRRGTLLSNIGSVYKEMNEIDSAMYYFKESLKERESVNSLTGSAISYHNIANLYIEIGQHEKAIPYALEEAKLARQIKNPVYKKRSAGIMYHIYKFQGKYKESLESLERFNHLKDSIKGKDIERDLLRQEFSFEYTKKAEQDSIKMIEAKKVADARLAAEKAENEKKEQQAYFLYGVIALVIIFGVFVFNRFLVTRKQRDLIDNQKNTVERKNHEILDSINYAKGIQEAILPPREKIAKLLKEHFVLYKPKDVVAGDFYWVDEWDEKVIFAVADCTGHGVPGAMVSVVCHNALHRCIHEFNLTEPNKILDKTRELVIETFESSDRQVKDGMDIALCVWDSKSRTLKYAGANNNLYVVHKNGSLSEFKADKQPIGIYAAPKPFKAHEVDVETGDNLYLFTDGVPDQFGGSKGKKLKYKNVKTLLLENHSKPMLDQKERINRFFEDWRGELEQLDDVCIIGIRV